MNRLDLESYISNTYNTDGDFPWKSLPTNEVFRHKKNKKWFALIMDLPKEKLGLDGEELLSVVNLKCEPLLIGSFQFKKGIFPAYHMNKNHWITVALDGSVADAEIEMLVDMSYELTK